MTNKLNFIQERVSTWRKRIKDLKINISKLARLSDVNRVHLNRVILQQKSPKIRFVNNVERVLVELERLKREAEVREAENIS